MNKGIILEDIFFKNKGKSVKGSIKLNLQMHGDL